MELAQAATAVAGGLPAPLRVVLITILLLATCVWIGGWSALVVVARSTTATLSASARVDFFRHFGRVYGTVSTIALVIGLVCGGILLIARDWTGLSTAIVVLAVVLLLILGWGVLQARSLTRMRRALHSGEADADLAVRVSRRARAASVLRAMIGVLSVAVMVLAIILVF